MLRFASRLAPARAKPLARVVATAATAATLAALLTACQTPVALEDPAANGTSGNSTAAVTTGGGTSTTGGAGSTASSFTPLDPFNPQSRLAQERSVYFEFDSYAVPDRYRELVETHSRYLAEQPRQRIMVEGHTDERGGAEYNLALGQRRADAVRRLMTLLGVSDAQIETISFGREKPRATGSTEADWAQNRRADIVYQR